MRTSDVSYDPLAVLEEFPWHIVLLSPPQVILGDTNGDDAEEIVLFDPNCGPCDNLDVYDAAGGQFASVDVQHYAFSFVQTGDLDGDGRDEILVQSSTATIDVFSGTGSLLDSHSFLGRVTLLATGDTNQNGRDELLLGRLDLTPPAIERFEQPVGSLGISIETDFAARAFNSSFLTNGPVDTGDVDGDGIDDVVVYRGDRHIESFSISPVSGTGVSIDHFDVGAIDGLSVADVIDDPADADEIIVLRDFELLAFDVSGNEVARLATPSWILLAYDIGKKPGPDQDGDGLLDGWERAGINTRQVQLPLHRLNADPLHKDIFVELDWMPDPERREARAGTCNDMLDNDGDLDIDGADLDCLAFQAARPEAAPNSCSDGVDNDGAGGADAADGNCIVFQAALAENGTPNTCGNGLDDDGDGHADRADSDCSAYSATAPEAAEDSCGNGVDDDGDGDADEDDSDCREFDKGRREASADTCGDGLDNDGDGVTDRADFDCLRVPGQAEIRKMKTAFCAAPLDAGGRENPDGRRGINLWVDTGGFIAPITGELVGGLVDPQGIESDVPPCSCGDGIDNDADGDVDGMDADCRVWDPTAAEDFLNPVIGSCNNGIDDEGVLPTTDGVDQFDPDCLVYESALSEGLPSAGTCSNGSDDDADGLIDSLDPSCSVGDPLGGGNALAAADIGGLSSGFYDRKRDNFDRTNRSIAFHYAMSARGVGGIGGVGERGGNDFVEFNHDGGTVMHELGHNLGLSHGGGDERNCKPNYVSVMNYDNQSNIQRRNGTRILDYSPPRFPGGRGNAPLPTLRENDLDESLGGVLGLDPADGMNMFRFKNGGQIQRIWPLDGDIDGDGNPDGVDWSGDGDQDDPPLGSRLRVNLDTKDIVSNVPKECANSAVDSRLDGYNDWENVSLPFRQFGDSEDSARNPVEDRFQTLEELIEGEEAANAADLSLRKRSDSPTVEVGDLLAYAFNIENRGPNPAFGAEIVDQLPVGVSYVGDNPACVEASQGHLVCDLGVMMARTTREPSVTVSTDGLCDEGIPSGPITNVAHVSNVVEVGRPDPTPADNVATITTTVVDTTPPDVACNAPSSITPLDAPISFTATATDICDDAVSVEITDYDCFAFTKNGKRVDKTESCIVSIEGGTLTIVDSGGVGDHVTWTARSTDRSLNPGQADCEVQVERP